MGCVAVLEPVRRGLQRRFLGSGLMGVRELDPAAAPADRKMPCSRSFLRRPPNLSLFQISSRDCSLTSPSPANEGAEAPSLLQLQRYGQCGFLSTPVKRFDRHRSRRCNGTSVSRDQMMHDEIGIVSTLSKRCLLLGSQPVQAMGLVAGGPNQTSEMC
jgi:hypothetical protein